MPHRTRKITAMACAVIGAACLLGLGAAAPASGQQGSAFGPTGTFGVEFRGGSIQEFVESLREASGEVPVNVIVSGTTDGLDLPPIVLEQVNVLNAVKSLEHLNVEPYHIDITATNESPTGVLSIAVYERLSQQASPGRSRSQRPEPKLEVISLTELLEGNGVDDGGSDAATLLTAIDTALAMAGETQSAELKFHPDSRLLIISGSERQTGLVKNLIGEVHDDVIRRRQVTNSLRQDIRLAEIEVQKAEVELQSSHSEVQMARESLDQLRQLHASGMVGDGELMQAERQLKQLHSLSEIAELEREQRSARLKNMVSQLRASEQRFAAPTTEDAIKTEIDRLRSRLRELEARLDQLNRDPRRR